MFNKPLNLKLVSVFLFLCFIEILVVVRPVTLFLVRTLHVPKEVLFFFEVITTPVTVFILSLYVWQLLGWKAVYRKVFAIGYGAVLFLIVLAAFMPKGASVIEGMGNSTVVLSISRFFLEIGTFLTSYTGWHGWSQFGLSVYLMTFVIFPLCAGFLATLFYLGGAKIKNMVR